MERANDTPAHCCECARNEDAVNIATALIHAASHAAFADDSRAGAEEKESTFKYLRAYWEMAKPNGLPAMPRPPL